MLLSVDEPTITCRPYVDRLKETVNPRHRKLLETVIEHDQAEAACDIEGTMATLTNAPEYVRFWGSEDVAPKGYAEVRSFYEGLFARGGIGNLTPDVKRIVVDDHTVIAEFTVTAVWPGWVAKDLGCDISDEAGYYAIHRHLTTVIPFDDDLKMSGERSYGGGISCTRVPAKELSAGYFGWVEKFHPRP